MSFCYFCKKDYEGYAVLLDGKIESLLMEEHIKDIYYDKEKDVGVCESCRKRHIYRDPVNMIRSWLPVRCQLTLALSRAEKKGDSKKVNYYNEALKRIDGYEKKLEETPEVKKLYMENNPARFKAKPKKKINCYYCGEEPGNHWINDPNQENPTIDKCWWVCDSCDEGLELQQDQSMHAHLMQSFPTEGGREQAEKCFKKSTRKIKDFEKRTGKKMTSIELREMESGYKAKDLNTGEEL